MHQEKKYKVAVFLSHPIHYLVAWLKEIQKNSPIEIMVYFGSDFGLRPGYDQTFKRTVRWYDESILQGLPHIFLKNLGRSSKSPHGFFSINNPKIFSELKINSFDALVLHGYNYASHWFALIAAVITKTPVFMHGESNLLNTRSYFLELIKKIILSVFFKNSAAFLSLGTLNTKYYLQYNVPKEKIFLTPYAVNNSFFTRQYTELNNKRNAILKEYAIKGELPIILFASKMIERKGPLDLLKAFEPIRRAATLVFVGDGPEKTIAETYVAKHKINNVYFFGFKPQEKIVDFYSIADIFVLPSHFETWGLVINEAMNFCLPIITTTMVGGSYDLVRQGENGFAYRPGDIQALTKHLQILIADEKLRKNMGVMSQKIIETHGYREATQGLIQALEWTLTKK